MTDGGARWRVRVWGPVVRGVSLPTAGAEPGRPRAGSCCLGVWGGLPPPRLGETSGREPTGVRGEPPGLRGASVEASRPERWIWARALLSPPACCFSGLAVWSQTPAPTCARTPGPPQGHPSSGGPSWLTAPALALVLTWCPVQMPTFPLLSSFRLSALTSQSQRAGERGHAAWGQLWPDVPRGAPEAREGAVPAPVLLPVPTWPRPQTRRGSGSVQTKQRQCHLPCASRTPASRGGAPVSLRGAPLSLLSVSKVLGASPPPGITVGVRPRPADRAPYLLVPGEHGQGAILGVLLEA